MAWVLFVDLRPYLSHSQSPWWNLNLGPTGPEEGAVRGNFLWQSPLADFFFAYCSSGFSLATSSCHPKLDGQISLYLGPTAMTHRKRFQGKLLLSAFFGRTFNPTYTADLGCVVFSTLILNRYLSLNPRPIKRIFCSLPLALAAPFQPYLAVLSFLCLQTLREIAGLNNSLWECVWQLWFFWENVSVLYCYAECAVNSYAACWIGRLLVLLFSNTCSYII